MCQALKVAKFVPGKFWKPRFLPLAMTPILLDRRSSQASEVTGTLSRVTGSDEKASLEGGSGDTAREAVCLLSEAFLLRMEHQDSLAKRERVGPYSHIVRALHLLWLQNLCGDHVPTGNQWQVPRTSQTCALT